MNNTTSPKSIRQIEAEYGARVVAVVREDNGSVHDHCFNWETAQTFALDGYYVEALADDGYMTKETAQALYDAERERHDDCFGRSN